jgi:hypothetical protein
MIRAAKLDVHLYEEVEADTGALGQAMTVVVLSSMAAGVPNIGQAGLSGVFIGIVIALVGWFVWAFLTYIIGTKLLPEPETHANLGELLRTIGFASSPGLIRIAGIIPGLGRWQWSLPSDRPLIIRAPCGLSGFVLSVGLFNLSLWYWYFRCLLILRQSHIDRIPSSR